MTRDALRRRGDVLRPRLRAGPAVAVRNESSRSRTPGSGQSADLVVVAPGDRPQPGARYAAGMADDLLTATLLATRAPCSSAPPCTPRCGSTRRSGEPGDAARAGASHRAAPETGQPRRGDVGRGTPGRAGARSSQRAGGPRRAGAGGPERTRTRRRPRRVACSSPPAARASRSTRSAFIRNRSSGKQGHAIAARRRAPRRRGDPRHDGRSLSQPDVAGRVGASTSRPPPRWRRPCARRAAARTSWSWRRPSPTSGRRSARCRQALQGGRRPRDRARADGGHPRRLGRAAPARPGPRRLRRRDRRRGRPRAPASCERKGVDLLVVNDVSAPGAGFDHDTNAVVVLGAGGERREIALTTKDAVATGVLDSVIAHLEQKRSST